MRIGQKMVLRVVSGVLVAGTLALTGCGAFFVCAKASCTTNSSTSSTVGNVVYVANSTAAITSINGYVITSGTLVPSSGSPYALTFSPTAMTVSRANTFLYVGSNTIQAAGGTGAAVIYGYSLGANGALTVLNSGSALLASQVAGMTTSPDGQWLVVMSAYDGSVIPTLTVYGINTTTGALTYNQSVSCTGQLIASGQNRVKVAPSGNYIAVALGTGGVATYAFNTTNGAISVTENLIGVGTGVAATDIDIDSNNFLYLAATSGLITVAVSSTGVPAMNSNTTSTTSTVGPFSVALDGTSFVYGGATNSANVSTVYEFTPSTSGTLPTTTTTTSTGPTTLTKLAVDSTGKYLLADGYNTSSGLQMFSIGSTGALTFIGSAPTGATTTIFSALALTH